MTAERKNESAAVSIARLQEILVGMRDDISEIKANVGLFDHRITYLEDVRVRAIEEREIRRNAIADERDRASRHGWGRWEKFGAFVIGVVIPIVAALLASGRI